MSDVTNADNGDDDNDVSVDPRKALQTFLAESERNGYANGYLVLLSHKTRA